MPARATSSATISFGLVSIPIKVYAATQSKSVRFNMLDASDHSRMKQQYVNPNSGEVVPRDRMVKGYEHTRGQFVVFTEEELKALEQETSHAIEIEEFVPIAGVDPLYFEKSNFLGPDKGGQKAYRLLAEAMTRMGRVAIGRHATRGRQQLVLIRPFEGGLVLQGLYRADEVRSLEDVELGDDVELAPKEIELATDLIERLSTDAFEPGKYQDQYRETVLAAVDRKVAGEEVIVAPKSEAREQIVDLVEALKRSLADKQGAPAKPGVRPVRKPAKAKGRSGGAKRKTASK